jgi:hypothetical protein
LDPNKGLSKIGAIDVATTPRRVYDTYTTGRARDGTKITDGGGAAKGPTRQCSQIPQGRLTQSPTGSRDT